MSDERHELSHAPCDDADTEMASVDEVEFAYPTDRLARRPRRKPLEPGFGRTLGLAALAGVGLGIGVYHFKPEPRSALAVPPRVEPRPTAPVRQDPQPNNLFELPIWDEAAYQRDLKAGVAPAR